MYARITKDKLNEGEPVNYQGLTLFDDEPSGPTLEVRLLDDDREVYYYAKADDEALEKLFDWAMKDSGVTILQVRDDVGDWIDTIS